MSKLECERCGHLIVDQTDDLPYKAWFVGDADDTARRERIAAAVAAFVAAREPGARRGWFRDHFPHEQPANATDEDILYHFLTYADLRVQRLMYECLGCGALYVEDSHGGPGFACYAPTDGAAPGILSPDGRRDG